MNELRECIDPLLGIIHIFYFSLTNYYNKKLDVFEKNACLPPARSSVRAVEGRQRTRYDRFETEAFNKVRRTCTYIYMNINKGYGV